MISPTLSILLAGRRAALLERPDAFPELQHYHPVILARRPEQAELRIRAGEPATLEFAATRTGRFELELHKRHTELGALEVYPQ